MMNNHPEAQWLSAYMDDELSAEQLRYCEDHVASCEQCQLLLNDLLSLKSEVRTAYAAIQAPDMLEDAVLSRIQLQSSKRSSMKEWIFLLTGLFILSIFLFMLHPIMTRLLSVLATFLLALVYMFSHYIASIPLLTEVSSVLSVGIVFLSSLSLRRLLQTTRS